MPGTGLLGAGLPGTGLVEVDLVGSGWLDQFAQLRELLLADAYSFVSAGNNSKYTCQL